MSKSKIHEDLRTIAAGVGHALKAFYKGKEIDFVLVVALPVEGEVDLITLNTITAIKHPDRLRTVGLHLVDMANSMERADNPLSDVKSAGHA